MNRLAEREIGRREALKYAQQIAEIQQLSHQEFGRLASAEIARIEELRYQTDLYRVVGVSRFID